MFSGNGSTIQKLVAESRKQSMCKLDEENLDRRRVSSGSGDPERGRRGKKQPSVVGYGFVLE